MAHLGNNGALLGPRRISTVNNASGLWSLDEHKIAKLAGIWPEIQEIDPYWDNVSLLLKMEDANGETSFTDSSANALTMTSTAVVTTTQYRFGTRSADFQSGSKVIESPASSLFNLPGDFTIEMWARWSANPNPSTGYYLKTLFTLGNYTDGILFRDDGLYVNGPSIYSDIGLDNDNDWHHYAVSRSGSSLKAFKDGTSFVTVTQSGTLNSASGSLQLGRSQHATGSEYWVGQIDEVRITKGICRYTANFTPRTAPFPSIGPEPVINPIPALAPVLWYDFADEATVTTSGTEITAVTSKGSRDWTLTKSTTGPQYVTGINGKKCLDWGASPSHPNFMYNSDTTSTTIGEVYVVVDASFGGYAGNYAGLFTSYSNDWYVLVYASSIAESGTGFNQLFVNGGTASLYSSGLFASPSIDNPAIVRIKNSSGTPFNTTGGFEIGNDRGNSSLNRGWCGLIGEYIVFPSVLNSTDRAKVENYLSEKWGISLAA